jgi:signal transduction histidine kinase
MLEAIAELLVPAFADGCVVDVIDEHGALRRVVVRDASPAHAELAARLKALAPPRPEASIHRVIDDAEASVAVELVPEDLAKNARNEEHLAILRGLDPKSGIVVPLRARGRAIGIVWLYVREGRPRYGAGDLAFARDLVGRVALALDNARLFRDAQEAIRLRDEFLSIASHELKTPLTPLKLQIGRLRREPLGATATEKLESANRQIDRLTRLVDQLLDVSRITGGRLRLEPETVDLGAV